MPKDDALFFGIGSLILGIVMRLLPVGAIRGGVWMLRGPVDDTEREFLTFFTRTLFPIWLVLGLGLLVYALI